MNQNSSSTKSYRAGCSASERNSKILRECSCSQRNSSRVTSISQPDHSKNTTESLKSCLKKTATVSTAGINRIRSPVNSTEVTNQSGRTWFQVLMENPKKTNPDKLLRISENHIDIPLKYATNLHSAEVCHKENIHANCKTIKRINLLWNVIHDKISEMSDTDYLQFLADIRRMMENINKDGDCIRNESPNSNFKRRELITDDDKYNFRKPALHMQSKLQKSNDSEKITLKALIKLLENMEVVKEREDDQKDMLENLTVLVNQLRGENKMINKFKEIRLELESKLASLNTDYQHVKERLAVAESENEGNKHLLEVRRKEVEFLKKHIASLKMSLAGKMNCVLGEVNDQSIELQHFNDTIASLPLHQESFDMLIRPASSSPTEDILQKHQGNVEPLQEKGSTPQESVKQIGRNIQKHDSNYKLKLLKDHIGKITEKFTDDLETNLKRNTMSCALSDVTYRGSP